MDNKYKYDFERTPNYCYPDSDVLINKLDIKNSDLLYIAEQEYTTIRTIDLKSENITIKGNLDFDHLKSIHRHLFQDVYNWAGEIRICNIAKKDLFCLAQYIESFANDVFTKFEKQNYFLDKTYEEKITALVELFSDINALHPFREGNGRTQREFVQIISNINGILLDFTPVTQEEMILASHDSINGKCEKFITMFKSCCSPISKENQLKSIDKHILSKNLKNKLKELIK